MNSGSSLQIRGANAVIFGGAGFIGRHLAAGLVDRGCSSVALVDLVPPAWPLPSGVRFVRGDVRSEVCLDLELGSPLVFNLAAVHRTPGHHEHEYFETNVLGAATVTRFCRQIEARRLWFASSIAVYGPSEEPKTEDSDLRPATAYGLSKVLAERLHRDWAEEAPDRHLVIARPATVFGSGEGGNFTRLAKALEAKRFVYPGRRDTLKACGYVTDLVASMLFMEENALPVSTYNFAYPKPPTIYEICEAFCSVGGYSTPLIAIPEAPLKAGAAILNVLGASGYHPERVAKLVHSTNIVAQRLQEQGFRYSGDLRHAFTDWFTSYPSARFV